MDANLNPAVDNAAFRKLIDRLAEDSGSAPELSSPGSFEMLLADSYPVRVTVHPDGARLVVDIYLYNTLMLSGEPRANVVRSLLLLNHVALRGRRFALAIDNRGYVLLTASRALGDSIADSFHADLEYLLSQAQRTRAFIHQASLAHVEVEVELATQPA